MDNIFGVDIDPLAVKITKYCLAMKCSEDKDCSLVLDKNILCGNSLINLDQQRFFVGVFEIQEGNGNAFSVCWPHLIRDIKLLATLDDTKAYGKRLLKIRQKEVCNDSSTGCADGNRLQTFDESA